MYCHFGPCHNRLPSLCRTVTRRHYDNLNFVRERMCYIVLQPTILSTSAILSELLQARLWIIRRSCVDDAASHRIFEEVAYINA